MFIIVLLNVFYPFLLQEDTCLIYHCSQTAFCERMVNLHSVEQPVQRALHRGMRALPRPYYSIVSFNFECSYSKMSTTFVLSTE